MTNNNMSYDFNVQLLPLINQIIKSSEPHYILSAQTSYIVIRLPIDIEYLNPSSLNWTYNSIA